jgi:hypothetical protein
MSYDVSYSSLPTFRTTTRGNHYITSTTTQTTNWIGLELSLPVGVYILVGNVKYARGDDSFAYLLMDSNNTTNFSNTTTFSTNTYCAPPGGYNSGYSSYYIVSQRQQRVGQSSNAAINVFQTVKIDISNRTVVFYVYTTVSGNGTYVNFYAVRLA